MALTGAVCVALTATVGFTNKSRGASVSQLLDRPYKQTQMTYDLRRLRLKGLIVRVPHTNSYVLSPEGIRATIFYTKLDHRLLHPLLAAHLPPALPPTPSDRRSTPSTTPWPTTSPTPTLTRFGRRTMILIGGS